MGGAGNFRGVICEATSAFGLEIGFEIRLGDLGLDFGLDKSTALKPWGLVLELGITLIDNKIGPNHIP